MRRVFKTRSFSRWMRKTELVDSDLCAAVAEMAAGLVASDALKEICHDSQAETPQQDSGNRS